MCIKRSVTGDSGSKYTLFSLWLTLGFDTLGDVVWRSVGATEITGKPTTLPRYTWEQEGSNKRKSPGINGAVGEHTNWREDRRRIAVLCQAVLYWVSLEADVSWTRWQDQAESTVPSAQLLRFLLWNASLWPRPPLCEPTGETQEWTTKVLVISPPIIDGKLQEKRTPLSFI